MSDQDGTLEQGKLYVLPTPAPEADEVHAPKVVDQVVRMLEELLARAKTGDLVSAMVVCETPRGGIVARWTDDYDYLRRIGAIESMKHDWLTRLHLETLSPDA